MMLQTGRGLCKPEGSCPARRAPHELGHATPPSLLSPYPQDMSWNAWLTSCSVQTAGRGRASREGVWGENFVRWGLQGMALRIRDTAVA